MTRVRPLSEGDEALLEAFLSRHADSSMFLRSNARAAGLADTGEPFSAAWVAAVDGDEVVGVAAHCWNGVLLVQAPRSLPALAREAAARSGRAVAGIGGEWAQVTAAREALGLDGAPARMVHRADLFALSLEELAVPRRLSEGELTCRPATRGDLPLLLPWRVAYAVETLGQEESPELTGRSAGELGDLIARGSAFVLTEAGRAVSFSGFNARLPGSVQVGGVYTPPPLRGKGLARAAVAGSLLSARAEGASRAILFTETTNVPARRAYEALGFSVVGDYGMVLL